mgnify:FL=1
MKIHRFIGSFDLDKKEIVITDPEIVHQLLKVLRFKKGDIFVLADGQEKEMLVRVKKVTALEVVISREKMLSRYKEVTPQVSLYLALLKKENFEWVAQKATEIGISELIPVHTDRVVKQNINEERVRKIMKEAAEQSGQVIVPKLLSPVSLKRALEVSSGSGNSWFMDETGVPTEKMISKTKRGSLSLFIGPEGGWTEEEKTGAKKMKAEIVSLGETTLRAETAAIIAAYIAKTAVNKSKKAVR